jgi:hypothetical protein
VSRAFSCALVAETSTFAHLFSQETFVEGNPSSSPRAFVSEAFRYSRDLLHDVPVLGCQHHHVLRRLDLQRDRHDHEHQHADHCARRSQILLHHHRVHRAETLWQAAAFLYLGHRLWRDDAGTRHLLLLQVNLGGSRYAVDPHVDPCHVHFRLHCHLHLGLPRRPVGELRREIAKLRDVNPSRSLGDDWRALPDEGARHRGWIDNVCRSHFRLYCREDLSAPDTSDPATRSLYPLWRHFADR